MPNWIVQVQRSVFELSSWHFFLDEYEIEDEDKTGGERKSNIISL